MELINEVVEIEQKISQLLISVHEVQHKLLQTGVSMHRVAKYLNPYQQTLTCLSNAQGSLELADRSVGNLVAALNKGCDPK